MDFLPEIQKHDRHAAVQTQGSLLALREVDIPEYFRKDGAAERRTLLRGAPADQRAHVFGKDRIRLEKHLADHVRDGFGGNVAHHGITPFREKTQGPDGPCRYALHYTPDIRNRLQNPQEIS